MTCINCKHEFCYKCLRDWRAHSAASAAAQCTAQFDAQPPIVSPSAYNADVAAQADPNSIGACIHRYRRHNLRTETKSMMNDIIFTKRCAQKQDGVWWSDTFYLEETLQRLFDLCRVVRDTSVFIFFLEESNSRALLMDQLLFLHANVEKLRLLLLRSTAQDKAEVGYMGGVALNVKLPAAHCTE